MSGNNSSTAADSNGRGADGRFGQGNQFGTGNPFARRVAELRQALLEAVTPERLARLVAALLERAEGGDVAAARLVLSYALGRPARAVDPDRLDLEEAGLFREAADGCAAVVGAIASPGLGAVLPVGRAARRGMDVEFCRGVRESLPGGPGQARGGRPGGAAGQPGSAGAGRDGGDGPGRAGVAGCRGVAANRPSTNGDGEGPVGAGLGPAEGGPGRRPATGGAGFSAARCRRLTRRGGGGPRLAPGGTPV